MYMYIAHLRVSDFPLSALNNVKNLTLCEWQDDEYLPDTTKPNDSVAHKFQLEFLSLVNFRKASLQKVIS